MYNHQYPASCPECGADLTQPDTVLFTALNQEWRTCLDNNGNLVDVDDLIKNGYHQSTDCPCGCNLNDHETI